MRHPLRLYTLACVLLLLATPALTGAADLVDLRAATIVARPGDLPAAEHAAAEVLQEELEARLGRRLPIATGWPTSRGPGDVVLAIASGLTPSTPSPWAVSVPADLFDDPRATQPEGFRVRVDVSPQGTVIWLLGADARGALFAAGELLRALRWTPGGASPRAPEGVPASLDVATAPAYPIRGHQLGYRAHSNTYDAFDEARYDRYIRELALFGANSIENIPFQDTRVSPHFPLPRAEMNLAISRICARYDVDYWIWTPADFDLEDLSRRAEALTDLEALFERLPRLDAVFVPGGDPGHNAAPLVLPYLRDMAERLQRHHPDARVWLSLQWFPADQIDWIYDQINTTPHPWLGGLVAGPSSPPLAITRARLHPRYQLRDYPDITHTVRSQYVVPAWDPAFNFTLGREPVNPRPVFYAALHDRIASHTDGFISYSDGVNDDVNKAIWSRKGWSPDATPREILIEYGRFFFGEPVAVTVADGLLALEKNWEGPLATNGAVDGTLRLWQQIEADAPSLAGNWRWQMALLRAYYDAYTRHRLIHETAAEHRANALLAQAASLGARTAVQQARSVLDDPAVPLPLPAWRTRLDALGAALFASIGMQLSVPTYGASGAERGAVLDFLDYPLNNRWWLEDEFARVLALPDEAARLSRLEQLAHWESPGAGSFYDDIGHVGRSPRVLRARASAEAPWLVEGPTPHFLWEDQGLSRKRLSWQTSLRWPLGLVYDQIDREGRYVVRLNGNGDVRLRINGALVAAEAYSQTLGEFKTYTVPADAVRSGRVALTFDPIDESHLNWRQHSRLNEVWLLRMVPR
jgi:hypothetical protein